MGTAYVNFGDGVTTPKVTVKIVETAAGEFRVEISQAGPLVGDLRGLFFDVAREALVSAAGNQASAGAVVALTHTGAAITSVSSIALADGDDAVTRAGGSDNNLSGALAFNGVGGEAKGYDVGLEFGTSGIGKDDVGAVSFTLKLPGLTLADLASQDFGLRMTSVGLLGGDRSASVKLTSAGFVQVEDADEALGPVYEDTTASGDVLQDQVAGLGGVRVEQALAWVSIDGGATRFAFGVATPLGSTGATLVVNADGTYVIDAQAADALRAGAAHPFTLTYGLTQTYFDAAGHTLGTLTETSAATLTVTGVNDVPVVHGALLGEATEDGPAVSLSGLGAASDVDVGDVLSVTGVPAELPAGVTFDAASGLFTLEASGAAYQALAQGETATVSVDYGVTDGLATAPAQVRWTVTGANDAPLVSGPLTAAAVEDGPTVSLNPLQNASDVDNGAVLSVVDLPASLPPGVTYDPQTGLLTLDPAHPAFQSLGQGQTVTVTVDYGVSDGLAVTPARAEWTVTGVAEPANPVGPPADHFPLAPKDLSHVTFYFDLTPADKADSAFFFAKVETPTHVNDDLDAWYEAAVQEIVARTAALSGAELVGAAVKYGSAQSGGGEFYYALDGDLDQDAVPTGFLVQGSQYKLFAGGVTYNYDDLF